MVHLLETFLELGRLVFGMSTVWEDTHGCVKKYMCPLDIYLVTVLLSSYDIIMGRTINAPGHVNNVVDGLNATEKCYLKVKMEIGIN